MPRAEVTLRDGQRLEVRIVDGDVELAHAGIWSQRLTREEAWQLAEALDAVATADDED